MIYLAVGWRYDSERIWHLNHSDLPKKHFIKVLFLMEYFLGYDIFLILKILHVFSSCCYSS